MNEALYRVRFFFSAFGLVRVLSHRVRARARVRVRVRARVRVRVRVRASP